MSEWITDRLPTAEDVHLNGMVWAMYLGDVVPLAAERIPLGTPWMPISRPAPYVKPKPWTVEWDDLVALWCLRLNGERYGRLPYTKLSNEAAQRICDIYNEVVP